MPRSVFLGRVVKPGEPMWLDEDRSYALALVSHEDDQCSGCGQPLSETTAMRNGKPVHTYEVDLPEVCGGCSAMARDLTEYEDDPRRASLRFRVIKKT